MKGRYAASIEIGIAHLIARCFTHDLGDIASSFHLSAPSLTARVGALLSGTAGGEVLGAGDSLSALRRKTAKGAKARRTKVALDDQPHRRKASRPVKKAKHRHNAWWDKLDEVEKQAVIAKRVESTRRTRARENVQKHEAERGAA